MATKTKDFQEKKLFQVVRELNVSEDRVVEFLEEEGYEEALSGSGLNAKIVDEEAYLVLREEYADDAEVAARIRELRSEEDDGGPERDEVATLDEEQAAEPESATETAEEAAEPAVADDEEEPRASGDAAPEAAPAEEDTSDATAPADAEAEPSGDEASAEASTDDAPADEAPTDDAETAPVDAADEDDAAIADEQEQAAQEPDAEADASDQDTGEEASDTDAATEADATDDAEAESAAPESTEAEPETPADESEAEDVSATDKETASAEEADDHASDEHAPDEDAEAPEESTEAEGEADDTTEEETSAEGADDAADDEADEEGETLKAGRYRLKGPSVVGKMDSDQLQRPDRKRKRKDKDKDKDKSSKKDKKDKSNKKSKSKGKKQKGGGGGGPDEEDIEQTLQETLQELEQGASRERQRRRRRRRKRHEEERQRRRERKREQENILEVTEFVTTGELANLIGEPVSDVIDTLFDAGMMVSINQRLDTETIEFVADEYGYEVEFVAERDTQAVEVEEDDPEDLEPRAPVVTVMGHVDHGKTSLLDYVRNANVVAGEEGGITQHVGAHYVELTDHDNEAIAFLDTPGHEAFTAMRARGAKATDIVILVVAADDSVMPRTKEAINHAQAADVPIVVAINKMDKREADAEKVRAELADQNVLVEEYGGDVQSAEVSAKTGDGINELLDKVLLQSEIMELKANPNREASGVIIESRLEKGRGNVITVLVQNGTLETGDPFLAGIHSGSVRAMFNERDNRIESVGPSQPALVLGCDGSPEVGDQFVVMDSEGEARDVAQERQRIHREQELRRQSQVSLDQVSRQMAEGEFHELNLIIKADVGGSVEALSDALLKLKTDEVAVNVIHSGVGAITESDVMLARASDAIILGFQVRPTSGAREASQREEVDIRTYSVIYAAIEDVRDALEGLLSPERREETKGRAEVRDTFSVPDVGMVAGCYVNEGTVGRNQKVRLVRDGVVQYEGEISSLKRFEEDVSEVQSGYECGLSIENFDDLKVGDELETYVIVEEARELEV
ncbi:translation initiation factor IF-2 [Salinibacter ruber]|uniref:Translation initiation factor IF-2 n=1 Tax=Salinibacter ruber (strain M8) TaxID=761659 RepID=D5HA55_SALRM|nr:translation initiation factor IF-2 [Salinibacter ruber]MCS3700903.1 translation initiation factor IF-2 [Salinibacter ruber]MCS3704755.1 translation initiation factor IF-2 [Salinibacter ruber]MCS4097592.1 translation initiation factor IF-2 [Salinibacter ruber]MCS4146350.1 translation initiation factor IF-2 [Salinibacter ruber]CBH24910.1 Translation initiation factor IF-2 [Salinibacter ruber M8]